MKKKKGKKRAITLIEIMIVILLIGLIGGALAFNMRGSMDKGKIFKTEQNIARVSDALTMAIATGEFDPADIDKPAKVKKALADSPMIKDAAKTLKDGWGEDLTLEWKNDEVVVKSAKLQAKTNAQ